ncbi:MAG: dicarboxylate/amino acid:cation symporter [Rhodothermales bacterium]|nr:dicarboxylate/amino acid:cation symporter [Rhodothermales bacterium]MBO6780582.1 dicarboxylate/amino acid:cation symporter [Rhodothermales bacterium]
MPWYKKLHWQIIIGLVLGVFFGIVAASSGWGDFTTDWISPFGVIFINLLKLIAVPLIIVSLVTGVASLSDLKKLSRIGGKTIAIYIATTVIALIIGLTVVNLMRPGDTVPPEMRDQLQETYAEDAMSRTGAALEAQERGPLQPIVDMVPENFFGSAANNRNMLQVVFVAIFLGIGMLMIPAAQAKTLYDVFEAFNDLVIKLVEIIMIMAPIGVFALMADTIVSIAGDDLREIIELLTALGYYCIAVLLGLVVHMCLTYFSMVRFLTPIKLRDFLRKITPVQLVAFSTSSSGATLPVTMETAEKELGVSEEVSSFVLPLGATINMDGTGLYQAVAAVFIAQTLGLGLDLGAQLTIVFTAVLASIGTAAVPSAGIVMLVIILESVSVPAAGIALILGVDRILDMCRTVTNVTGDLTVATVVAASEDQFAGALAEAS